MSKGSECWQQKRQSLKSLRRLNIVLQRELKPPWRKKFCTVTSRQDRVSPKREIKYYMSILPQMCQCHGDIQMRTVNNMTGKVELR